MNTLSRSDFLRGNWITGRADYKPSSDHQAKIGNRCLAINQVLCRACEDACEQEAVYFRPTLNSMPQPWVDADLCDGCGECFRLCPVSAIRMIPRAAPQETAGAPSPQIQARGDAHD